MHGDKVKVGVDERGRPIYDYIMIPGITIHVILQQDRVSLSSGGAIRLNLASLNMLVSGNEVCEKEIKVNSGFMIHGSKFKVVSISRLRIGLLEVTLEKTP